MGKVLTNKAIRCEGFKTAIQKIWRTVHGLKTESLGNNTLIFQFQSATERKRVLTGGPWIFDKALLILTEPTAMGELS